MARSPCRPRTIAFASDGIGEAVASGMLIRPVDPRQPDLFDPGFIAPCKPTLRERVPVGPLWHYEIKHDGYRTQAHAHGGRVRLYTKSGLDYSDRMPRIAEALARLGRDVILDGEAVMTDPEGVTDFFALHAALASGRASGAMLYAFDLLALNGEDLRSRPLAERRALLAELLIGANRGIGLSEHMSEEGEAMLGAACRMGLEGIVAKRIDKPYRSGPSEHWIKVKCTKTAPFAVIGYDPAGARGVASLRLAHLDEAGRLVPAGWAGSGLSEAVSRELRAALDGGVHVVADVEFRGWTPAGELRHPVFKSWHRGDGS